MKVDETKSGFSGRELLGEWQGYKVFNPVFDDESEHFIGYPMFILVDKNGNERWDKGPEEAFEIIHFFDDETEDEEEDDFEN